MITSFVSRLLSPASSPALSLARLLLSPLTLLYAIAVTARNALYDNGLLPVARVDVPVVSVGNLTVGGTGKTPFVIALARRGIERGKRVAIVTRGYGAAAAEDGRSDEVVLIADRCPEAQLVVSPDRATGAREAAAAGAEVVLLDDGFQHRRLARDLDIVVLDAHALFGGDGLLPSGGLREPPAALGRADVVVLTHREGLDDETVETLLTRIRAHDRSIPIVFAHHEPVALQSVDGSDRRPATAIAGRDVYLFCGIGAPEGFRRTVEGLGANVQGLCAFPDHHDFRAADIASVRARARSAQLVCTEKDAVKVARIPGCEDVLCVTVDLVVDDDGPEPLPAIPGIDG